MLNRVAIHEAAHAIAFLEHGHAVTKLRLDTRGGGECCANEVGILPRVDLLVSCAGPAAEEYFLGATDTWASREDFAQANFALRRLSCCGLSLEGAMAAARQFVAFQHDAIVQLAGELERQRIMVGSDLAKLCWQPGSHLAPWQVMYAKPKQPAKIASQRPIAPSSQKQPGRAVARLISPDGWQRAVCPGSIV